MKDLHDHYRRLYADLPENIRALSVEIAVKEMIAARTSQRLGAVTDEMTRLREQFQKQVEEVDSLKAQLRNDCRDLAMQKESV